MESGRDFVVPFRYGIVNHGVYRGAYPTLPNFRFLHQLKLKTIVSLVPEKPSPDLQRFAELLGIDLVHVRLERGASLNANLHIQLMKAVNVTSSYAISCIFLY